MEKLQRQDAAAQEKKETREKKKAQQEFQRKQELAAKIGALGEGVDQKVVSCRSVRCGEQAASSAR